MQKILPILWFILGGVGLFIIVAIATFGTMRGMGAGSFAQMLPSALVLLVSSIGLGIAYMVFLRVASSSAAGILGIIHWFLALLSMFATAGGFAAQQSMMTSGNYEQLGLVMGIAFAASTITSLLGWFFFIGAAAVTLSAARAPTHPQA